MLSCLKLSVPQPEAGDDDRASSGFPRGWLPALEDEGLPGFGVKSATLDALFSHLFHYTRTNDSFETAVSIEVHKFSLPFIFA